jgi:hypothetical protein
VTNLEGLVTIGPHEAGQPGPARVPGPAHTQPIDFYKSEIAVNKPSAIKREFQSNITFLLIVNKNLGKI